MQPTAAAAHVEESAAEAQSAPPPPVKVESDDDAPLQLGQLLKRVFETHPQVQQAISEVEATRFTIDSARAGYYPYLQVQSAISDKPADGSSTLSVVQPLWDGGLTGARVTEAKRRRDVAFASLTQARLSLSQDTLSAAFDILGADAQIALWDQYMDELKASQATMERRAKNGVSPESDVQTVGVRLSQAESGRETSRATRISARSRLSSLISGPPPPLAWPNAEARLRPDDLGGLLDRVDLHPSMQVDRENIDVQKAVAKGTKASIWPQLSLQHRQQIDGARFDPSNDATLLVLQYQTTSGLRAFQGAKAEQAKVNAAESRLNATRASLQAQFRSDSAQLLALATQIASQERSAKASTELVDSYRRQFEVGRKSWLELLNAQREAHDSRVQFANLKRNYWQTNSRLVLQAMLWDRLGLESYLDPTATPSPTAGGEPVSTEVGNAAHE